MATNADIVIFHAISQYKHDPETFGWLFRPMLDLTKDERDQLIADLAKRTVDKDEADVSVIIVKQNDCDGIVAQPGYPEDMKDLAVRHPGHPVFHFKISQ